MNIGHGDYKPYMENVNYVTILEGLAMEGAEWSYVGGKPKGFEVKYLDKVVYIWKYIICSRLILTRHYSSVNRERAILSHD